MRTHCPRKWTAALLLATLAFCTSLQAQIASQAFVPESGFYWNAAEPGRGYSIEIQDRFLFMTVYTFTEEGNPAVREALWFFASGGLLTGQAGNALTYSLSDELFISSEGQCLGCDFVDSVSDTTGRPLSITFTSLTKATLVINGEIIPIERFWYSPSIADTYQSLLGQWMFAIDCTNPSASGNCFPSDALVQPFNGDIIDLFDLTSGSQPTVDGFRAGTSLDVSAAYDGSQNLYVMVVSETADEFLAYYFFGTDFGTDRILGFAERFRPGDNLQFNGFLMWGLRISDRTYVEDVLGRKRAASSQVKAYPRPGAAATLSRNDLLADPQLEKAQWAQLKDSLNRMVRQLEQRLGRPQTKRKNEAG